jgi:hypothetical protein
VIPLLPAMTTVPTMTEPEPKPVAKPPGYDQAMAAAVEMKAGAEASGGGRCAQGEAVFWLEYSEALLPGHIYSARGRQEFQKISHVCEYHFDHLMWDPSQPWPYYTPQHDSADPAPEDETCDVCQQEPVEAVLSMPFVPFSVAYGKGCRAANAHPYGVLVMNTAMVGGLDETNPEWQEMVEATLMHLDIGPDTFRREVEETITRLAEDGLL